MRQEYADIKSRLGEPLWYDENGTPRYEPFQPRLCSDIYAKEAALLLIECQACGETFEVAVVRSPFSALIILGVLDSRTLAEDIESGSVHYGDPPAHDGCPAGPTMNCIDKAVLQYWRKREAAPWEWERIRGLEGEIEEEEEQ